MLQRKLLARLGLLVVGFIAGAVVSIVLLQGVLRDLDNMNSHAAAIVDGVQDLSSAIAAVEAEQYSGAESEGTDADLLKARIAPVRAAMQRLDEQPAMQPTGVAGPAYQRVKEALPAVLALQGGSGGPGATARWADLRQRVNELAHLARHKVAAEQLSLSRQLRVLIVGLTIAALVMVNITIAVLLQVANMILRPVRELVEGSRALAMERFDARVKVDQNDEFAELAHAYNRLAEELSANEARKVQALQHLAVTLNHELNNAINIINLQLRFVDIRSGGDPTLASHLRQIHENLERVSRTIASLRNVRRIVLTDYMPGEKMLDLSRSVASEDQPPQPSVVPKVGNTGARVS